MMRMGLRPLSSHRFPASSCIISRGSPAAGLNSSPAARISGPVPLMGGQAHRMPGGDQSPPQGDVGLDIAPGTEGKEGYVHETIVPQSAGSNKPDE